MALLDAMTQRVEVKPGDGDLTLLHGDRSIRLHPQWLRERSQEEGQIEATNRQRLFTPLDLPSTITVLDAFVDGDTIVAAFSDGHRARLDIPLILRALGWLDDPEEPPAPEAWTQPLAQFPYVDWSDIGWSRSEADPNAVLAYLDAFYRHGYVVFRNTPTEPGTLRRIADRLGYIVTSNFGTLFDVRVEQAPTDLAYTAVALPAHTDQPYRRPIPGIQLLHALVNEAPGGDSTLVDGLAAAQALAMTDPEAHRALVETEVVYRYDMGSDTVVSRGHILNYDRHGRYTHVMVNTKLDEPVLSPGIDLDAFYRGRRLLCQWLNDPAHQVTFRLEPGDVMFMDNMRVLHGRTAFDPSQGSRHLQGCYLDHDAPDTMYRLTVRQLNGG